MAQLFSKCYIYLDSSIHSCYEISSRSPTLQDPYTTITSKSPWWWSSGQYAQQLLWRSKFVYSTRTSLHILLGKIVEKN